MGKRLRSVHLGETVTCINHEDRFADAEKSGERSVTVLLQRSCLWVTEQGDLPKVLQHVGYALYSTPPRIARLDPEFHWAFVGYASNPEAHVF